MGEISRLERIFFQKNRPGPLPKHHGCQRVCGVLQLPSRLKSAIAADVWQWYAACMFGRSLHVARWDAFRNSINKARSDLKSCSHLIIVFFELNATIVSRH